MIEFSELDIEEETECVHGRWARLRQGIRHDRKIVTEITVWEHGVLVGEYVEFYLPEKPLNTLLDIVWKNLREGFRLAQHNELTEWQIDDLRHG